MMNPSIQRQFVSRPFNNQLYEQIDGNINNHYITVITKARQQSCRTYLLITFSLEPQVLNI